VSVVANFTAIKI